eukprot:354314-Chlamydomonas_euryale.AAC.28
MAYVMLFCLTLPLPLLPGTRLPPPHLPSPLLPSPHLPSLVTPAPGTSFHDSAVTRFCTTFPSPCAPPGPTFPSPSCPRPSFRFPFAPPRPTSPQPGPACSWRLTSAAAWSASWRPPPAQRPPSEGFCCSRGWRTSSAKGRWKSSGYARCCGTLAAWHCAADVSGRVAAWRANGAIAITLSAWSCGRSLEWGGSDDVLSGEGETTY